MSNELKIHDHRDILLAPVVSEKSYGLLDENKYTFLVAPDANKTEIKIAVEKVFGVKVTAVNTINQAFIQSHDLVLCTVFFTAVDRDHARTQIARGCVRQISSHGIQINIRTQTVAYIHFFTRRSNVYRAWHNAGVFLIRQFIVKSAFVAATPVSTPITCI